MSAKLLTSTQNAHPSQRQRKPLCCVSLVTTKRGSENQTAFCPLHAGFAVVLFQVVDASEAKALIMPDQYSIGRAERRNLCSLFASPLSTRFLLVRSMF
jgi:hypothetical protein